MPDMAMMLPASASVTGTALQALELVHGHGLGLLAGARLAEVAHGDLPVLAVPPR